MYPECVAFLRKPMRVRETPHTTISLTLMVTTLQSIHAPSGMGTYNT